MTTSQWQNVSGVVSSHTTVELRAPWGKRYSEAACGCVATHVLRGFHQSFRETHLVSPAVWCMPWICCPGREQNNNESPAWIHPHLPKQIQGMVHVSWPKKDLGPSQGPCYTLLQRPGQRSRNSFTGVSGESEQLSKTSGNILHQERQMSRKQKHRCVLFQ